MSYLTHAVNCVLVVDDICSALADVTKRVWLRIYIRQHGKRSEQKLLLLAIFCVSHRRQSARMVVGCDRAYFHTLAKFLETDVGCILLY